MKEKEIESLSEKLAMAAVDAVLARKSGKVEPCLAHIEEVRQLVVAWTVDALRRLYTRGEVGLHQDVNKNPMFYRREKP